MKLNVKIIGLVIMVTAILIVSALAYHFTRIKEEKLFNYAYYQNTSVSIQSILHSRERALDQNLEDNSAWDDMVKFIGDPDTVWSRENLETTRKTLDLDLIQIYNTSLDQVWAGYDPVHKDDLVNVITAKKIRSMLENRPTCHFFENTDAGILELYGSIVVPSTDIARKTQAKGYLFFGRLWDKNLIADLENSSNSTITVQKLSQGDSGDPGFKSKTNPLEIVLFLKDSSGKNIVKLDFLSKSFFRADNRLFYLFTLIPVALTLVVLFLFFSLIRSWITIPIRKITYSLDNMNPDGLSEISSANKEFFSIAKLIEESFENRKNLEKEIAERKKAEEKISRYADELKEINNSKDKFFSILAHDLKSPFHYLLGYSDLLRNEFSTLNEEDQKKFISIIHSNSQRLYNLLENLLEWSRIQTGRVDLDQEVFDLSREVKQICETVKTSATHKNITLECYSSDQAIINADRNMIRSSIHNLLTNAIKYTPERGTVIVRTNDRGTYAEVSVKDTGIGMTPEEVAKLFRIDVSVSRPGTNKEPGTGLGLILTKEFIEKNDGSVVVESEPDRGSLFRVTLPLYKA